MSGPNTDPYSSDIYSSVRPSDYPTSNSPLLDGYRQLSPDEVALANRVKALAAQVGHLVGELQAKAETHGLDPRWVAEGRTDLQKGFMSLVRAITRPTTF
jgi:hypothetical protein